MKKILHSMLSFLLIFSLFVTVLPCSASAVDSFSDVEAKAAILIDTQYGTILYEKNIHEKRPLASITKVMTALLIVEGIDRGELSADTVLTASLDALSDITSDSSTQNIKPGEQMSVEHLLYCLLCPSANEAANILAEGLSGSVSAFVEAMNTRAQELGMTDTHFSNPHGLDRDDHYSSAYDIYLMSREAMTHPLFQKIVATSYYTVPTTNLSEERLFYNTNALLSNWKYAGYTYSAATGIKTGHTPEAGFCLVSSAQQKGRTLIAVVLGADTIISPNGTIQRKQFTESKRLLQWGFSNFKAQTLLAPETLMREIPVTCGKGVSYVLANPSETIQAVLPLSYDSEQLDIKVSLKNDTLEAPVKKGQVLGQVTVNYEGKEYGTSDLVATSDVERSTIAFLFHALKAFLGSLWFRLLLCAFVLWLVVRLIRSRRRVPRKAKQLANGNQKKPAPKPKSRR